MNASPRRSSILFGSGTIAAVALVAVIAANAGAAGSLAPSPSAPPVATPKPSPIVAPVPTSDGVFDVDLDISGDDEVSIVVDDESGEVTGVSSGHAGDGMSVRWGVAKLENVDEDTLRLTWVGLPGDARLQGLVKRYDHGMVIFIVQPEPPANSDALGSDRVLLLDFSESIQAEEIRVVVQEGLDTSS